MSAAGTADEVAPVAFGWWLGLIGGAGLVVRIAYLELVHVRLGADAIWYSLQAGTIAGGHGFVDPAAFYSGRGAIATANFPPLWPSLLALADQLGFGSQFELRVVGALLGSVTVVVAGLLARRLVSPRTALLAAALVAVSPFLVAADGSLMAETLFTLLVTTAVLVAYLVVDRPGLLLWAALGLLLGLAALTRGDGLVIAPVLLGVTAWRARVRGGAPAAAAPRRVAAGLLLAAVVLVATLVPWSVRSSSRLGTFVAVSTNTGSLLEGANCPATYSGTDIGLWLDRCLHETRRPGASEATWSAAATDAGLHQVRAHAARFAALVAPARVLRGWGLWAPRAQARAEAVESRSYRWQLFGWGVASAMLACAVGGAIVLGRRRVELGPILAVAAGATLVLVLSWGDQRFRLVAEPAVVVLAAAGIAAAWARVRRPPPDGHASAPGPSS